MAWREVLSWVYGSVVFLTYGGYLAVVGVRARDTPLEEVAYVTPLLISIGVSIVATIVGTVLGAIVGGLADPTEVDKSDERDDLITSKGELVGFRILSILMLVPFGLAMADIAHFWIANTIYLGFVLSALGSTTTKVTSYRRGY